MKPPPLFKSKIPEPALKISQNVESLKSNAIDFIERVQDFITPAIITASLLYSNNSLCLNSLLKVLHIDPVYWHLLSLYSYNNALDNIKFIKFISSIHSNRTIKNM